MNAGAKAGTAVGVVLAVLLIGGALIFVLRSRRQKRNEAETATALELLDKKMQEERGALVEKKRPMMGGESVFEAEGDARGEMQGTQVFHELGDTSRAADLEGANHSNAVER
jgi:hypothetical protein